MLFIKVKLFFDVLLDSEGRGCTKLTEGNTGSCGRPRGELQLARSIRAPIRLSVRATTATFSR